MRHRVYGKHLSRSKNQRTALFKGLARSLILHESINTTEAKAKAIKGLIDRLIVRAKSNTNPAKQFIQATLPDMQVVKKLIEDIAPRYQDRNSGFTSVIKLGNRSGDGAMVVKMSLVGSESKQAKESESKRISASEEGSVEAEEVKEIKEEKKPAKKTVKKDKKEDKK